MSQMLNVLKGFVRQPTGQKQADDRVHLHVTHSNLKQRFIDIRVDLHTTIEGLKEKIRDRCITAVKSMQLQLYDIDDKKVYEVLQDFRHLGFSSSLDGYRMHITDKDPTSISAGGWLEKISFVESIFPRMIIICVKIADDYMTDIAARINIFSLSEMSGGSFTRHSGDAIGLDNKLRLLISRAHRFSLQEIQGNCRTFFISRESFHRQSYMRCLGFVTAVKLSQEEIKCEKVKFVGRVETLAGGVSKGKRYFTCPSGPGSMLRPDKLKIGHFPVCT